VVDEAAAQVLLARWVVHLYDTGGLHDELESRTSDGARIAELYHPVSFFRIAEDRSTILSLLKKVEMCSDAAPRPSMNAGHARWSTKLEQAAKFRDELLFAKNNVGLDDVGHTGRRQWRRLSDASTAGKPLPGCAAL
jgi:hypothetical protein